MADVDENGTTSNGQLRPYSEVRKGYTPFRDGDLLVAKITPCFENGKIAQAILPTETGFGSTEFHVVRPHEVVDDRYLLHFLRSPRVRADGERRMTGSAGQRRVPITFLEALEVPLPPLPEQRRIAAILDQADALRAKRENARTKLTELLDARFAELLARWIGDSHIIRPLGSVADVQGGITVNRRRAELAREAPYLRVANIFRGAVDLTEVKSIGVTDAEVERVGVMKGDLLVVEGHGNAGEVGRAAMWRGEDRTIVHQNHLIRIRFGDGVRPAFVEHYLNSPIGRKYITRIVKTTSGLNTLNIGNVRAFPILVPPIVAQEEFESFENGVHEQRAWMTQQAATLETLFASLQHRAFRAEL